MKFTATDFAFRVCSFRKRSPKLTACRMSLKEDALQTVMANFSSGPTPSESTAAMKRTSVTMVLLSWQPLLWPYSFHWLSWCGISSGLYYDYPQAHDCHSEAILFIMCFLHVHAVYSLSSFWLVHLDVVQLYWDLSHSASVIPVSSETLCNNSSLIFPINVLPTPSHCKNCMYICISKFMLYLDLNGRIVIWIYHTFHFFYTNARLFCK